MADKSCEVILCFQRARARLSETMYLTFLWLSQFENFANLRSVMFWPNCFKEFRVLNLLVCLFRLDCEWFLFKQMLSKARLDALFYVTCNWGTNCQTSEMASQRTKAEMLSFKSVTIAMFWVLPLNLMTKIDYLIVVVTPAFYFKLWRMSEIRHRRRRTPLLRKETFF